MAETFGVRDFDKQQHYQRRAPPWIKLYNTLLDDYAFSRLPDAAKAHLVGIFLLASRHDNCIPYDAGWVGQRINARETVDLDLLAREGFILRHTHASALEHDAPKRASTERESETESETEESLSGKPDDAPSKIRSGRKTYPESFEAFWRDYPTDPIMSKTRTFAQWRRLSPEDQQCAHEAVPGFRAYCRRAPTYRPVHAERFLGQRRFDGFKAGAAADKNLYREHWNGEAARLLDAVGAGEFHAWFADAVFAPGPPPRLILASVFRRDHVEGKFGALLRQLYGDICLEVAP